MLVLFKAILYVVLIFDANGEAFIDMTLREIATVVIVKIYFSIQFNSMFCCSISSNVAAKSFLKWKINAKIGKMTNLRRS